VSVAAASGHPGAHRARRVIAAVCLVLLAALIGGCGEGQEAGGTPTPAGDDQQGSGQPGSSSTDTAAGTEDDDTGTDATEDVDPGDATEEPPSTSNGASGEAIRGRAVAVSDVVGDPESAITEGWVLTVPESALERLWEASDREPPADLDLPYWNATLPAAAVEEIGASVVEVGADGSFVLEIPAGRYLVCLLERDDPIVPFGCDHADLDPATPFRLTAGEGGIRVE
jgi:hypothetical protein